MELIIVIAVLLSLMATEGLSQCGQDDWLNFKRNFGKRYANQVEETRRRAIFCQNLAWISDRNNNLQSWNYTLEVNQFGDITREELKANLGMSGGDSKKLNFELTKLELTNSSLLGLSADPLPVSVDWRQDRRVVGYIKNQGTCGSCWAFTTVALMESMQHRWMPNLTEVIPLSEQQLVDCDTAQNGGCAGGDVLDTLDYIKSFGGLMRGADYMYESGFTQKRGPCRHHKSLIEPSSRNFKGFKRLDQFDERLMMRVLAEWGPISVYIRVPDSFVYYKEGVFYDPECEQPTFPDHGVLLVGYGTSPDGQDYWIIRNSWGYKWGEQGYGLMARNGRGHCLIDILPIVAT